MGKTAYATRLFPLALVAVALAACALLAGAQTAWAGAQPGMLWLEDLNGSITVSIKGGIDKGLRTYSSSKSTATKISNVKSSNKKVATAKVQNFGGYYALEVQAKKPGTTTISYKVGGKSKSVKYKVVKYTNPVKSFKVNGKEYASSFAPKVAKEMSPGDILPVDVKSKTLSGKVNLKLAKGWKVKKMWYWYGPQSNAKMKYFKNGQKVNKAITLYAWVQKGKQRERICLYCNFA